MVEINREIAEHHKHLVLAKPEFNTCDLAVQVRVTTGEEQEKFKQRTQDVGGGGLFMRPRLPDPNSYFFFKTM